MVIDSKIHPKSGGHLENTMVMVVVVSLEKRK
jgi:hypothetical protein